jgi:hypothetical protein
MKNYEIMNTREIKKIKEQLRTQFGIDEFPKGVWVLDEKNKKLWLTTPVVEKVIKRLVNCYCKFFRS